MTITGIELALEASRPNSLIYVFTDSSAKDYNRTEKVLNLIQQKQSQVVFVLTGFCNTTDEPGFEAYRQIATVSSGQLYIIGKGQVNEFMQVVEAAVEARKVHILQQDTLNTESKTYSFPVDSHLSQLTIQVTNHQRDRAINVKIRNPEGKLIDKEDGLKQLMKAVKSVFVGSIDRPKPGQWTLEVGIDTEETDSETMDMNNDNNNINNDSNLQRERWISVRVSGISDVDFLQGFSTTPKLYNYGASTQPIAGVQNYIMVNMTGRFLPGQIDHFDMRGSNGSSIVRLPVQQTETFQIYVSQQAMEPITGHYYLEVSGRDGQGYPFQRCSKVALSSRQPQQIVVTCPAQIDVRRGATAELSCSVTSEIPYTVKWFKDKQPITGYHDENKVYNFPTNVLYTITDVNEESHGIYSVEVIPTVTDDEKKIEGQYKDEISVNILPPPPRVLIPRNASVEPRTDAIITCNIFSLDENIEVKWYRGLDPRFELKNGRRHTIKLNQDTPAGGLASAFTSTLTIRSATESDSGKYICEAEHKGGISEADGFLIIHTRPVVNTDEEIVTFKEGSSLVLSCRSEGVPKPKIIWAYNDVPITISTDDDQRITVIEEYFESRLIIRPAKSGDAGNYSCIAINSAGNRTINILANFISPPKIDKLEISSLLPVEGQEQIFTCHVTGKPKPKVKWDFNGSPVTSSPGIHIDGERGVLKLLSVRQDMKGEWTCLAESIAGYTRESVLMDVGFPPKVLTDFTNSKVLAEFSMDTTLSCPITGQPLPNIKWYRVTGSGNIPLNFGNRYILQADNSLLIHDVNMEDGGVFICEAVNMYGKVSHSVTVEIGGTKAPSISFTQPKQLVLVGTTEKQIICNVLDAKPAATVIWLKDNQPIDIRTSEKYYQDGFNLIIRDIEIEDEGIYTCIARNVVGKAKFDIELDVQGKPKFLDSSIGGKIDVTQGDNLVLECKVEGDPKPIVEWRKDGRIILPQGPGTSTGTLYGSNMGSIGPAIVISPDGYTLTIYSVTEAVTGSFTCSAINVHAIESKEFEISVKTPPVISKEGSSEFELGNQEVGLLTCIIAISQPPAKVTWYKDGRPLEHIPGRINFLDHGHTVEIRGKNEEDSGSYECRAENVAGIDSRFYQVTILIPPEITTIGTSTRRLVQSGHKLELECGMTGYPEPKLTWYWNGKPLSSNDDQQETIASSLGMQIINMNPERKDLFIQEMSTALQGNYTCKGMNKGGSTDLTYEVILLEKPRIDSLNEKAVVFVNNTITLTCEATGSPPPNITWLFKGKPLDLHNDPGYRLVGPKNLMLLSARPYQGGEYECIAENEAGIAQALTILTVFEPTGERNMAQNLTIRTIQMGGNITFTCVMSSNPPAQIKWFKDEEDIYSVMPQDRFSISSDGSALTILNVRLEDQGQFKCLAVNIPGSWNYHYTLEVTSSPGILRHSSSPSKVNVNDGQELRLQCLATANPEPVYQWLKDDTPLSLHVLTMSSIEGNDFSTPSIDITNLSSRYELHDQGRLLLIRGIQTHDAGRFTCVASNPVGEDRLDVEVEVSSSPRFLDGLDHESPILERGKSNHLWCNVTGHPEPEIRWEYELPTSGPGDRNIQQRLNGRQLILPNVDYGIITRYICIGKNKAGEIKRIFDPTLVYPPVIIGPEGKNPRHVLQNSSTRLICDWEASPRAQVEWIKDGELITFDTFPNINISVGDTQLYLTDVQNSDAGNYRCVVTNEYGLAKRQWLVQVMSPPSIRFSSQEGEHNIALGSNLALFCVATGHPLPKITWTKDGKSINDRKFTISEDNVHLRLINVEENDNGRYACHVISEYGQVSKTFDVKITYGPRLDPDGQLQYSVERTVGASALLECLVSGNPRPKIEWFKDGIPLDQLSYRYRLINQDRQLEIISMQPTDAGRYRCVAKNNYGQLEINTDVSVGAPARIDRGRVRTEYTVREGDELVLPCPATGSPTPKLYFTRTGEPRPGSRYDDSSGVIKLSRQIDNLPKHSVISQDRQSLTIFRTLKSDSGSYQCNASNAVGWDIMEYSVRVRVPPTFDTSNVQPEVHWFVNQTRSLDCTLMDGVDPPPQIKWERNNMPIVSGPDIQISTDGSRITVPLVQTRDAGEYICHAQNEVGKSTQIFNVLIYVRPKFIDPTRKIHVQAVQNETIQLACEATGEPRPRFAWFKKDIEIIQPQFMDPRYMHSQVSSLAILSGDQLLQISNIQPIDQGEYACTASNGGGTIEKKFNVTVIVPPVIIKRYGSPEEHRTSEFIPITFYCLLHDINQTKAEITWTKDGSPILMSPDGDYFVIQDQGQSLTVVRPTGDEVGTYRCLAKNRAGEDSHSFQLSVIAAPRFPSDFVRYRQKLVVRLGAEIEFECPAYGSPSPTITWYYKGAPLSQYNAPAKYTFDDDGKKLKIISATGKDLGEYQCLARNEAGNISKIYELEVIMPPLVRLDKTEVREREGATFTVHCSAEGHPMPSLEWFRETGGLFRLGTSVDVSTGLLTITDAKKEDSGRYVCKAINKISEDSKSVMIEIIERPTIHTSMKPILARENEQILLPCRTSGTQPIRIQWLLPSGQLITTDQPGVFRLLPEQGLLLEKVRSEHAGRYRCSANNEAGFQNAVVSLEVLIPPTLVKPANLEVSGRLNSVLRLNCEVEGGSPTPTLTWERDGVTFSRTKSYYTTTESGLFIFNSLKPEDEGELTCIAKNAAGEDRITFRVFVQVPPRVSLPISTIGYEGKSVTMNCEADGRPKPEITWEFKGQPMTSHLGDRVRFETPTKVTIHDLIPSDGGTYSCVARSPGQEMAMDSTFLTIFTKPEFERTPNQTTEAYEARWIQFRCIANGHPKPEIRWMHNGNIIPSNPSKNGVGSLVLGPLRTDQAGRYTCVAKNDAGNVEYDFELKVKTRPKVHVYQSDEPPRESDTTRLRCEVSGDADSVIWLKDGNIISNSSRFRILDRGSSLVIKMAKAKDTGTYQCIAANPVGEDLGELRLVVESKPYLVNHPNNMTAQIGSVVVMECLAEGQPKPTITWYKDKQQIILRGHRSLVNNGSLRIVGVSSDDDGLYHCVASSSLGEDFSPPAFLQVQLDGRWSEWSQWSECSQTCGHGTQSRTRTCTNPAPKYGGAHCTEENIDIRPCLVKFCPTDGEWGSWTPWSACTATCGVGLSQRRRRCDSPPPSNGGRSCVGEAVEDVMCEGLPPCPVSGSWSPWSPWSDCSSTCGIGGTQNRKRTCDNPTPSNGGRSCPGQDLMVRACNRGPCPINGGWGTWSSWSHCSHSCGGGQRRRTRICDSPVPAYGGEDCPPTGGTETSECQSEPCPIHGDWSNWSSWSACSRTCGVGLQTRERECTQPQPQFGGRLCRGSAKEIRTCETQKRGSSEFCPNNEPGLISTWSEWSSWSECEPDCSLVGQISEKSGIKRRERTCTLLSPENESTHGCPGPAEEIQDCTLEYKLDKCQDTLHSVNKGLLTGTIRGRLNNQDIGTIHLNANWSTSNRSTNYEFHLTNVPVERSQCLQALTEIYVPGIWYAAKEVSGASNGHTIMGALNGITWESVGQFADGNTIQMSQRVLRSNDSVMSSSNESVVYLTTDIYLSGSCTLSLIDSKTTSSPEVELHDFHENLVQLSPQKGSLHSHSSRAFTVYNLEREKSQMEPYSWISTIQIGPERRQTYLTQELYINGIENKVNSQTGQVEFYAESIIKKPIGPDVCPSGFELNQARITGTSIRLQRRRDYCKDVDECAFPNLNKCDHVCKNTVPYYTCTCHKGYRLSVDGHSCIDIDECSISGNNETICPYGQRCINTHGSYECKHVCGPGLKENPIMDRCEDIDECQNGPGICGPHTCVNTFGGYQCICLPGYKRIGEICQDIDECLSGAYQCSENERCVNIPGSFRCQPACPQGYRAMGTPESNIIECVDIDECAIGISQCPLGSKCINEPGTYSCRCSNGQEAGTQGCDNRRDLFCNEGFQWNREKGCIDIDECNPSFGSSPCQYNCVNTYGAYRCECPIGYEIDQKTNLCRDIDECNLGNPCRSDEVCLNLPGNYTCVQQRCPKNYVYDKKSRSCRIRCSDSKLNCPHGAMFADTVEYLVVSLPSPESYRVTGSRIMLRVVDWHQVQQSNCHYHLLDKAPNTPVHHRTEDGVVYLTPNWAKNNTNQTRERTLLSAHIEAATNLTYQQTKYDEPGQLYYLFFRVSCYENDTKLLSSSSSSSTVDSLSTTISSGHKSTAPSSSVTSSTINNEYNIGNQTWFNNTSWDMNNYNQSYKKYKLIFQHSFYVYISISKYPF
ncbi:hypothetical protein MS3_00004447 [Schistosoma haematobium]|uniref:Hemicentin-1 n=1 Tax=Schistosoma haematobium TaxID=6185 RepID=A0A922S455_SCHHA|nr:hypothetical protein MS3_00004447 [Schistosoma haematobium]KAH9592566.1 hypothetical protein MS3_00004447 [Schistosoma haematobium]